MPKFIILASFFSLFAVGGTLVLYLVRHALIECVYSI